MRLHDAYDAPGRRVLPSRLIARLLGAGCGQPYHAAHAPCVKERADVHQAQGVEAHGLIVRKGVLSNTLGQMWLTRSFDSFCLHSAVGPEALGFVAEVNSWMGAVYGLNVVVLFLTLVVRPLASHVVFHALVPRPWVVLAPTDDLPAPRSRVIVSPTGCR